MLSQEWSDTRLSSADAINWRTHPTLAENRPFVLLQKIFVRLVTWLACFRGDGFPWKVTSECSVCSQKGTKVIGVSVGRVPNDAWLGRLVGWIDLKIAPAAPLERGKGGLAFEGTRKPRKVTSECSVCSQKGTKVIGISVGRVPNDAWLQFWLDELIWKVHQLFFCKG